MNQNTKNNKKDHEKKDIKELETFNEIIDCEMEKEREIQMAVLNLKSLPSGNIVALFHKYIIIYDLNFKEIQKIENAHEDNIMYVDIKDENNFVTCSDDFNIKTWIKKNGIYVLNKTIIKAHSNYMNKVKYLSSTKIVSYGYDGSLKIWKENKNGFEILSIWKTKYYGLNVEELYDDFYYNENKVKNFFIIKDKKRLVIFVNEGIVILDLNNMKYIRGYYGIKYLIIGNMKRISKNLFAIDYAWTWQETGKIVVLSLFEDKIIKDMKTPFRCYGMISLMDKQLFLVGGEKDIMIIKTYNFEYIKIIDSTHTKSIWRIKLLSNGLLATISHDHMIKI